MDSIFYGFFIFLAFVHIGSCLECFVCESQENNLGKCIKTIKTCAQEEDMCMTEIKWGTTPYWQTGPQKQYYVSKKCASKQQCVRTTKKYLPYCTHVWYEDWKCSECCAGDKCNFYIISGSSKFNINIALLVSIIGLSASKLFRH